MRKSPTISIDATPGEDNSNAYIGVPLDVIAFPSKNLRESHVIMSRYVPLVYIAHSPKSKAG